MERAKDVTSTIIEAMERADEMASVVIVYKLKPNDRGFSGVGWFSNMSDLSTRIGVLREVEHGMLTYAYTEDEE
jgi:hypothetical protein